MPVTVAAKVSAADAAIRNAVADWTYDFIRVAGYVSDAQYREVAVAVVEAIDALEAQDTPEKGS